MSTLQAAKPESGQQSQCSGKGQRDLCIVGEFQLRLEQQFRQSGQTQPILFTSDVCYAD
jgi:hypothetical protein